MPAAAAPPASRSAGRRGRSGPRPILASMTSTGTRRPTRAAAAPPARRRRRRRRGRGPRRRLLASARRCRRPAGQDLHGRARDARPRGRRRRRQRRRHRPALRGADDDRPGADAAARRSPRAGSSATAAGRSSSPFATGLTFSDGSPLTAEDVRRSWLRVIDPAAPSPLASLLFDVEGARAYAAGQGSADAVGIRADGAHAGGAPDPAGRRLPGDRRQPDARRRPAGGRHATLMPCSPGRRSWGPAATSSPRGCRRRRSR